MSFSGKESTCKTGDERDAGSICGLDRSFGERNGNPVQDSCLENSMDRRTWRTTVYGVTKSQTQLSIYTHRQTHTHTHIHCEYE